MWSLGVVMTTIEDVVIRLRAEFVEMPGMRLTPQQVQRLCGVERGLCQTVLDSLVNTRFLCTSTNGQYARVTDGERYPVRRTPTSELTRVPKHCEAAGQRRVMEHAECSG
jgi:hypothetical protein